MALPWIFTHSLLNLPNFKNSSISSTYYWLYSYSPPPEKFSADALGGALFYFIFLPKSMWARPLRCLEIVMSQLLLDMKSWFWA